MWKEPELMALEISIEKAFDVYLNHFAASLT
jgi:hypothetical protein